MRKTDLDRARGLARDIDRQLTAARKLALNLDLDLASARDLASGLDRARDVASALGVASGRDRDLERDLASFLDVASASAHVLKRELERDLAIARDLAAARDLDRDLAGAVALARARDLISIVDRTRRRARELEDAFAAASGMASPGGRSRVPMRLAGRLTAFAARLLPGPERARYSAEFRSELAEITLAGGGRRVQLAYACRTVLSASWRLRAALRSPRRHGAIQ